MQPAKRAADAQKLARRLQGFVRPWTSIQSRPPLPFERQSALSGVSARQQQRSLLHGAQQFFREFFKKLAPETRIRRSLPQPCDRRRGPDRGLHLGPGPGGRAGPAAPPCRPNIRRSRKASAGERHQSAHARVRIARSQDPSKYVGFDIDLGEADRRMPRLQADLQAGHVRRPAHHAAERPGRHRHLRHLRHRGAGQGRRLHHLFQGVRRRAGRQGQPEEDHRHQHLDVRRGGGREHRLCRGAADPGPGPACKAAGKPEPTCSSTTTTPTASRRSSPAAPTPMSTTSTPWIRRSRPTPTSWRRRWR